MVEQIAVDFAVLHQNLELPLLHRLLDYVLVDVMNDLHIAALQQLAEERDHFVIKVR